ncbi:MAG: bifunctional phosphoribosylaminoimidazolecarboxamide formyltransferase/IMP cyclohydrolase [Microscillaceae bacterium]|nr:bifunctional phosphoribosylaminoimidazolecarboxamide formyltransferase/IMP cyclohydrolase [Microscillaceae bacterium]MDW8460003.1 bifunctional phosphoribosylaminoimidazolecarboxamide formyltransferase/IMP cyclohydrolase [Cytophagales bacterium]
MQPKKITSALISVYNKTHLERIVQVLHNQGVTIYSTGGTKDFIQTLGVPVIAVEEVTGYPSILGGRVKTLHPKIFGGILYRSSETQDIAQIEEYDIPAIDLVIVDLYPFEQTLASGASHEEIIEKIDIGGVALIRAAAKNYLDTVVIASQEQYGFLLEKLEQNQGIISYADRRLLAAYAFDVTSHYDTAIFHYFNQSQAVPSFKQSIRKAQVLRYGENPHQRGIFYGDLSQMLEQLHGKELSYNNLVDIEAAIALTEEFTEKAFVIIKHTNACGVGIASTTVEAYLKAFACDTVSAFGGVLCTNQTIDLPTAQELNKLFFEVLIAPDYETKALELLKEKKNRILVKQKQPLPQGIQFKSLLNGVIAQDKDNKTETREDLKVVTHRKPSEEEVEALLFANKIVKHTKSNAIVLAKKDIFLASGVGQTSRIDALKQALEKAKNFGFALQGAVMASDAFFPFPDCVEIAHQAGITAIIQPGGSIKDQASIDYCNAHHLAMVFTGIRHFKH